MKRIMILCMAIVFILSGVANAEIKKNKDESGLYVCSIIEKRTSTNATLFFSKNVVGEEVFYRVSIAIEAEYPEWSLIDRPPSLSIDKYPDFYLDKYRYKTIGKEYSTIEAEVPPEIIIRLSKAEKVIFSSETSNGYGKDMLGRDFLAEWQEVINTTE